MSACVYNQETNDDDDDDDRRKGRIAQIPPNHQRVGRIYYTSVD